jgi:hypothetical protein
MQHGLAGIAALLIAAPGVAQVAVAPPGSAAARPQSAAPTPAAPQPAEPSPDRPTATAKITGVTPNAERTVTIGAINKRTGETRSFVGKPGEGFDFGGLTVRVRTCETTPPWEQKLTGAFLLIDERLQRGGARRVYSGWMFAESPSLHPLEHPRYDIWVKSCTMRFPDTGPATVLAGRGDAPASQKRSKAKKSAETPVAAVN